MLWFVYEHNECFFVCKIDGGVKTYLDHITHNSNQVEGGVQLKLYFFDRTNINHQWNSEFFTLCIT